MTDVYTATLLPAKPLSDDDSGFRYCFVDNKLLPVTHSTHIMPWLCWIDDTLWDCYIHADAVRALS